MQTLNTNQRSGIRLCAPLAGIVISCLLLGLAGCSTTRHQTKGTVGESGFLGDYSQMEEGVADRANQVYMNPAANWAKYTKVWVKPIELWKSEDPDSKMGKLSKENQEKLVSTFQTTLINTLSTNYTIVEQGGPDVLIFRAALTDAKKSKPVIGLITSIYLPLKLISFGKQALAGTGIGAGSVTIEAELLDGETNTRLAAVVDSRSGTGALRSKFSGTWGDVEKSFKWWAERLDQRLTEEKSGVTPTTNL